MISLVINLKCISRLNIHYYPNRRYKFYVTSLKAVILDKSFLRDWILIEIYISFFMIKHSKFTDSIRSGNFTDRSCQNTDKFPKSGGEGGEVLHPHPPLYLCIMITKLHVSTNYDD